MENLRLPQDSGLTNQHAINAIKELQNMKEHYQENPRQFKLEPEHELIAVLRDELFVANRRLLDCTTLLKQMHTGELSGFSEEEKSARIQTTVLLNEISILSNRQILNQTGR